jgi:hypothetical protein
MWVLLRASLSINRPQVLPVPSVISIHPSLEIATSRP